MFFNNLTAASSEIEATMVFIETLAMALFIMLGIVGLMLGTVAVTHLLITPRPGRQIPQRWDERR